MNLKTENKVIGIEWWDGDRVKNEMKWIESYWIECIMSMNKKRRKETKERKDKTKQDKEDTIDKIKLWEQFLSLYPVRTVQ